jgi:hypothetical protein
VAQDAQQRTGEPQGQGGQEEHVGVGLAVSEHPQHSLHAQEGPAVVRTPPDHGAKATPLPRQRGDPEDAVDVVHDAEAVARRLLGRPPRGHRDDRRARGGRVQADLVNRDDSERDPGRTGSISSRAGAHSGHRGPAGRHPVSANHVSIPAPMSRSSAARRAPRGGELHPEHGRSDRRRLRPSSISANASDIAPTPSLGRGIIRAPHVVRYDFIGSSQFRVRPGPETGCRSGVGTGSGS